MTQFLVATRMHTRTVASFDAISPLFKDLAQCLTVSHPRSQALAGNGEIPIGFPDASEYLESSHVREHILRTTREPSRRTHSME
jgi:hypothetical protein